LWRSPPQGEREEEAIAVRPRSRRPGQGGAARYIVPLLKKIVPLQRIPMRRLDLARLAVFPDPFTRLSRPVSDIICPARIILQDDGVAIPWCGFNRTAHAKDAYSDGVIGPFLLHFAARRLYSTRGKAQSTPFGTASCEGA